MLATLPAQKLPLNRRAIRSSRSTKINKTTLCWRQILALLYAVLGNKESALKLAERAIMLAPSAKDHMYGPNGEENLALIQMMVGENSSAISTSNAVCYKHPIVAGFTAHRLSRRHF